MWVTGCWCPLHLSEPHWVSTRSRTMDRNEKPPDANPAVLLETMSLTKTQGTLHILYVYPPDLGAIDGC